MKKLNILAGMTLGLVALLAASCDDDRDNNPVISTAPTELKINTPALADDYVEIDDNSTVSLSWSQPNYGFPTVPTYKIQVGEVDTNGNITWQVDTLGHPAYLPTTYKNTVTASLSGKEIARALCKIDGVTTEDQYVDKGYQKVAFRVHASIYDLNNNEVANTAIDSDPVYYNHLKSYFSVAVRSWIWLIGQPGNWTAPSADNEAALEQWKLYETEAESKIFVGTFDIPAAGVGGDANHGNTFFSLRFYKALNGWAGDGTTDGIGANAKDGDNKTIQLNENNTYSGSFVNGKGNWIIDAFPGGTVTFTVNENTNTVTFEVTPFA